MRSPPPWQRGRAGVERRIPVGMRPHALDGPHRGERIVGGKRIGCAAAQRRDDRGKLGGPARRTVNFAIFAGCAGPQDKAVAEAWDHRVAAAQGYVLAADFAAGVAWTAPHATETDARRNSSAVGKN